MNQTAPTDQSQVSVILESASEHQEFIRDDSHRFGWYSPLRWFQAAYHFLGWFVSGILTLIALTMLLAVLAAIPIVNLLALGCLIQAEGELARTGKWSRGFPLWQTARQLGQTMFAMMLFIVPLRYLGGWTSDASLIDPDSGFTTTMQAFTLISMVLVTLHLLISLLRGGRIGCFFQPRKNLRYLNSVIRGRGRLTEVCEQFNHFLHQLSIPHVFWTGFIGATGVLLWTIIPTTLFAAADAPQGPQILITLLGGLLLSIVCTWVPIFQAHYAAVGEFSAFTQWKQIRLYFRKTPCLWTFALLIGYALSLILYLFKIVAPPGDALWLMTLFFISVIYPARLLIGWVYYRASRLDKEPHYLWRKFWSMSTMLICAFYVFLLFFTRNIGANGKFVLYEQPLLLIPSPF